MHITHVGFDFDGTLVDSMGAAIRVYNEIAAQNHYTPLTADNLEAVRRMSILERCQHFGVPAYRFPGLVVQIARRLRREMNSINFHEGIPELLSDLRTRGLQIVILSTNQEENIRSFLKHHSAEAWVEEIYSGGGAFGKARLLRRLMRRHDLHPEQIIYVGDEHRDVEACQEVGVKVIAVRWGADAEVRLRQAGPDYLATRPGEIAECVGRWST